MKKILCLVIIVTLIFANCITYAINISSGSGAKTGTSTMQPKLTAGNKLSGITGEIYDVTKYGAKGGSESYADSNWTAFKQACAAAGNTGGTVYIPNGIYYLTWWGVEIPSNVTVKFESKNAICKLRRVESVKPDKNWWGGLFIVAGDNVRICGGQLCGDRLTNEESRGEYFFRYGIRIAAKRIGVVVDDMEIHDFRGDGLCIDNVPDGSGEGVLLDKVYSHHNTRQGLSIINGKNVLIRDSKFSMNTGDPDGPCAGIDMEPEPTDTVSLQGIRLQNVELKNNKKGLLIQLCGTLKTAAPIDIMLNGVYTNTDENSVQGLNNFILQGPKEWNPEGRIVINNFEGNGYFKIYTWTGIEKLKLIFNDNSLTKNAGSSRFSVRR